MTLLNRDFAVTLGLKRIASRPLGEEGDTDKQLRVVFRVEKTLDSTPNKASVAIYNLSADSRAELQGDETLSVLIEAGYVDQTALLFQGNLEYAASRRQGPDWVTTFESADGGLSFRNARIAENFSPGTLLKTVVQKSAEALQIGLGNVIEKLNEGNFRGGKTQYLNGGVLSGKANEILDRVMATAGFDWSIQDGNMQITRPGETIPDPAVLMTFGSGLVGSPERGEKGIVKARNLLTGQLTPGRRVEIVSNEVDGRFRIEKVVHSGDTWGADWYSDIEAKPL